MLKYNNLYFGWGDVTLNTAYDDARYLNERQTKTRTNMSDVRELIAKIYETEGERNQIKMYAIYSIKRPNNFSNADDPFYLAPRTNPLEDSKTNIRFFRQKSGRKKTVQSHEKSEGKWQIRHY